MQKFNKLALVVLTALTSGSVVLAAPFANQSSQPQGYMPVSAAQSTYLGTSQVPNPASQGGLSAPVNNLDISRQIGTNAGNVWGGSVNAGAYPAMGAANSQFQNPQSVLGAAPQSSGMVLSSKPLTGQPAWSQGSYYADLNLGLLPFGASLFQGHFAGTYSDSVNPTYRIAPGDRIVIRVWGARQYDDVLAVDQQGNIFIPEIGPVHVSGVPQSGLLNTIKNSLFD